MVRTNILPSLCRDHAAPAFSPGAGMPRQPARVKAPTARPDTSGERGVSGRCKNGARRKFLPRAGHKRCVGRRLFFVRRADHLHVFVRILVKILFAALAAEFHFLIFVSEHERLAHFAAVCRRRRGRFSANPAWHWCLTSAGRGRGHAAATGLASRCRRRKFCGKGHDAEGADRQERYWFVFFIFG